MSKKTGMYLLAMGISSGLMSLHTLKVVDFGSFAKGFALLVLVFAILGLFSSAQDRKAKKG
jgi:hypothetical protein